jgi:murein DD-endopeptidase MepM/ murein hydrolase activator NlpD
LNNGLKTVGDNLSALVRRHPKRVTALISALLLVSTGGAYAVASLGPDVSDVPVRQITESVADLPLQLQADALEAHNFNLFRTDVTRSSDTAKSLLARLGIDDAEAAAFLRSDAKAKAALLGRSGNTVSAEASDGHALQRLTARWSAGNTTSGDTFQRLVVEKTPAGFASRLETAPLTTSSRLAGGVIRSSLFAATDDANIPDAIASQLIEIFSGDLDFHRGLRKGDRFSIVYETLEADGEPLRAGRILSAEFVNNGKTYQAMWFEEPGKKGAYYTLDGQSLNRSFLASPVAFSRISSGFAMRVHPIQHRWKAHLGVDYAAPTGTPVRTVGDGVIEFAGVQNGFGNVVFVSHRNANTTVYAHLSRINVKQGQTVSQGDLIGAVGSTGWATGPHLHFEFRVNGIHQDPLTIAKQNINAEPVSAAARPAFNQLASVMRTQLSSGDGIRQASAQ